MGRPASRLGDADMIHCSVPFRAQGSFNVFTNGRPASRQGDYNTVHLKPCGCPPCCCPHTAAISVGSPTVYINGRQAGRLGDPIAGCTIVGMGSSNVFIWP